MFDRDAGEIDQISGKVGGITFLVRIYFKQHANWQGTVQWLESGKTVPFRSVLELIALLNEAVEKNSPDAGMGFRSWENLKPEEIAGSDSTDN